LIFKYEHDLLILFGVLGLLFLCISQDFLSVYLAIELQSLAFYSLASFNVNSEYSLEAGLKYFVLGSLSSILLLFGVVLLYMFSGASNFESFEKICFSCVLPVVLGFFLLFSSLFFKVGSVPFHF